MNAATSPSGPAPQKVAIIGSGNIGTDLMIKVLRHGKHLAMGAMVGIDPASDGLARASRMGVATTADGIEGLLALPEFSDIRIVFDATSASAHARHNALLQQHGIKVIDLTPAAIGPYVIPAINIDAELQAPNINMVTCGGQATIPMVRAVADVAAVHYAEIIASISSRSAGPGTRANIDEFTETTSQAIEKLGGARKGKAIIVLNPAEPPLIMRDSVFVLSDMADTAAIERSIARMVDRVQSYVPGYRLTSRSAGPGTRANIDEFTETTSQAIEKLGGARKGKAIIVLNPAEPPLIMRDSVFVLSDMADTAAIERSIARMVDRVQSYVPGYRLKQKVQFEEMTQPVNVPGIGPTTGLKTSVFLEVEGAAHYLPAYAGNLDIMTSAALACAERFAAGSGVRS